MANKNTINNRRIAAKNYQKGNAVSTFLIPVAKCGDELSERTQIITIGECKRKSEKCKVAQSAEQISKKFRGGYSENE